MSTSFPTAHPSANPESLQQLSVQMIVVIVVIVGMVFFGFMFLCRYVKCNGTISSTDFDEDYQPSIFGSTNRRVIRLAVAQAEIAPPQPSQLSQNDKNITIDVDAGMKSHSNDEKLSPVEVVASIIDFETHK